VTARHPTDQARLARAGVGDPARALAALDRVDLEIDVILELLEEVADPDAAVLLFCDLIEAAPHLRVRLGDREFIRRLVVVLGASVALGEHLIRHPESLRWLDSPDPHLAIAEITAGTGTPQERRDRARLTYRDALTTIAAVDLAERWEFTRVSALLADAAAAVLASALESVAAEQPEHARAVRLAIIAMGKTGGRELNYISDVDVIFIGEPMGAASEEDAMRAGAALASAVMRFCDEPTALGSIWPVDAALRPEGKDGPLVRSIESTVAYYRRWAKTWEFQALLKARPVAGDPDLGTRYIEAIAGFIWSASEREDFVSDVQAMRRRVEEHIPAKEAARQIKLGVGGLRDVEFAVQLLQLVHGKAEPALRTPNTIEALIALRDGGLVGREDADQLMDAYAWLRTIEHRIQLHRLRRTHLMPEGESDVRRLARSVGCATVEEFMAQWRERATLIRRLHEKLFYRPLLVAVARLGAEEQRLTPEAARRRLQALGYVDPAGAMAHLEALTSGMSRRAAIQKALLPAMLGWFADGPDPDAGLLGFRQLSDALGETPWYLRTLRDSGAAAQRLALVLSSSRYATELLLRAPEAAAMLEADGEFAPRGREALLREVSAVVARQEEPVAAIEAVRAVRRRELFRTSVGDLSGLISVEEVGHALSDVAVATLQGALLAAISAYEAVHGPMPTRVAVIAMGRLGGGEMGYPSDADVLFVHQPHIGADEREATEAAAAVAAEVRRLCALPSPEPPLLVDADLRPEGRDGPLVRTLASYASYYEQWGEGWERQALLRATLGTGDEQVGREFLAMADGHRFSATGLDGAALRELRRIKARVEAERLPRGADPTRHVKLGPGGLSDVEWLAQLLQLQWASRHAELRRAETLAVLRAAHTLDLVGEGDLAILTDAWRLATRIRNAIMLVRGRPSDELPRDARDLRAVAHLLGFAHGGELIERWGATSRRARATFERLFYGKD
jgi:glutamate-ammonia-ligase adenylyltransferase